MIVQFLLAMLAVLAVTLFVGQPLWQTAMAGRRERAADAEAAAQDSARADLLELEAERDAKLREIRDAELDWRTGKLTEADWQRLDASLRTEAAEILKRLDAVQPDSGEAG